MIFGDVNTCCYASGVGLVLGKLEPLNTVHMHLQIAISGISCEERSVAQDDRTHPLQFRDNVEMTSRHESSGLEDGTINQRNAARGKIMYAITVANTATHKPIIPMNTRCQCAVTAMIPHNRDPRLPTKFAIFGSKRQLLLVERRPRPLTIVEKCMENTRKKYAIPWILRSRARYDSPFLDDLLMPSRLSTKIPNSITVAV